MSRKYLLAVCAVLGFSLLSADVFAQRGRGGRGGFGRRDSSMTELLMRSDIRNEIELVDDQEDQLRQLGEEFRDGMRSIFGEIRDLPREERGERMRELFAERQKEMEEKVNDVLLEHQVERLKQLHMQSRMRSRGTSGMLSSDSMKDELGLTEEQLEEIKEVAEEAEKELQEEVAKARQRAQKKILGVLTSEQKAKWEKMVGKSFTFQNDREAYGRGREGGRERGRGGAEGEGRGGRRGGRGFGRGGDRGGDRDVD